MISVEEAIVRVLRETKPLSSVERSLSNADELLGCILARLLNLTHIIIK